MSKFTPLEKQVELYEKYLRKNGMSEVYAYELSIVWELELEERVYEGHYGFNEEGSFKEKEYQKDFKTCCELETEFWKEVKRLNH